MVLYGFYMTVRRTCALQRGSSTAVRSGLMPPLHATARYRCAGYQYLASKRAFTLSWHGEYKLTTTMDSFPNHSDGFARRQQTHTYGATPHL